MIRQKNYITKIILEKSLPDFEAYYIASAIKTAVLDLWKTIENTELIHIPGLKLF